MSASAIAPWLPYVLRIVYTCVEFEETPVPEAPEPEYEFLLCEGNDYDLKCPKGEELEITYAMYGRTEGASVCPHSKISDTNCTDDTHTETLRLDCNGKNECTV